jgi:YHS domain-containing protein
MAAEQQAPTTAPIVCIATGKPTRIADAAGHYLALHFLAATNDRAAKHVNDFVQSQQSVAGVRHFFISAGDAEGVKEWASSLKATAGTVYTDIGGAFAKELSISPGHSATVVLDPRGQELFRHSVAGAEGYLSWTAFSDRLAKEWQLPALKHYNLNAARPLAVQGYDVVAYFTLGKAAKGKRELASTYRGVSYHFSTVEHRKLFASDPEKYLPTYGGWCASAMGAKGTKVEIDPATFKVKGGRLFLFYNGTFSNALIDWNKREREWEPAADANWKTLTGENAIKPAR